MLANTVKSIWNTIDKFMSISVPIGEFNVTFWNMFYFVVLAEIIIGFFFGFGSKGGGGGSNGNDYD